MGGKLREHIKKFILLGIFVFGVLGCSKDSPFTPLENDNSNNNPVILNVFYDGNGQAEGNKPVDINVYKENDEVVVLDNYGFLKNPGFTFNGWNTSPDGTGISFTTGETLSIASENIILYAKWTANPTYTVTYDGNNSTGGSVPTDTTGYEENQTVTTQDKGSLIKMGYTFLGWNTSSDGNGITYPSGVTFSMGVDNVTLYAKWIVNQTYTVIYNGNNDTGGSVPTDTTEYEESQSVIVQDKGSLVKTDYTFLGWNTSSDGNGTMYLENETFPMSGNNIILYAIWSLTPTFQIIYHGNGPTGGVGPGVDIVQLGEMVTIESKNTLVKTGYHFSRWNTEFDGNGTDYFPSQTFLMGASHISLYAKWVPNQSIVLYHANGGVGAVPIDPAQYIIGDEVTVLDNTRNLRKTGKNFIGWSMATDPNFGTNYLPGETFEMGGSYVSLYAIWSDRAFLTYDGNGQTSGTVPVIPVTYDPGTVVNVENNSGILSKSGYIFDGWNTQPDGGGVTYQTGIGTTITIPLQHITLFAKWIPAPN